tara:strand:- start:1340 stop:9850 length:8511 start_codon:yes stop_codon:yes gene_type:complete
MSNKQKGHIPKPPQFQNTSNKDTRIFVKGMQKDLDPTVLGKDVWTHCINCINNTKAGDAGTVSNEQGNKICAEIPYTVIGGIHLYGDKWVIYSTDDEASEIGLFDDSQCTYEAIVNDPCLSFDKRYLITGASKENFDCSWQVYWDDGLNPSRTLNLDNIPYMQQVANEGEDCVEYENILPLQLDCERIRLAPLIETPTVVLEKSKTGGKLPNGSYQAFIAYAVNENKIGDYYTSNVQALFDHESPSSALNIKLTNLDTRFEGFRLVILSNNQGVQKAKDIGYYSTEQDFITIGNLEDIGITVPKERLPEYNPVIERSDKMFVVNEYLVRTGPRENFNFNYQCLANKIKTRWVSVEYPADYYRQGGHNPTFMRDEQYAFFIRWIYNTGDKSRSYHIPGREATEDDLVGPPASEVLNAYTEDSYWQVANTAYYNAALDVGGIVYDGGIVRAKGQMGYWESTELYPNDPVRWCDLCSKPIRHHKMPDEQTMINQPENYTARSSADNKRIYVLGVEFGNIAWPVDNDGLPIPNIVGYEILTGDRTGSESIVSKGLIRNMQKYRIPDNESKSGKTSESQSVESALGVQGLFPNYPYNDLGTDPYLSQTEVVKDKDFVGINDYSHKIFTYHSPDTSFNRPFLGAQEIKLYGPTTGFSLGRFQTSEDHPGHKLIRNIGAIIALVIGAGYAIMEMRGRKKQIMRNATALSIGQNPGPYADTTFDTEDKYDLNTSSSSLNLGPFGGAIGGSSTSGVVDTTGETTEDVATDGSGNALDGAAPGAAAGSVAADNAAANAQAMEDGQSNVEQSDGISIPPAPNVSAEQFQNVSTTGVVIPGTTQDTTDDVNTAMNPVISSAINVDGSIQADQTAQEEVIKKVPGHIGPQKQVEFEDSRYKSSPGFIGQVFKIMSFLNLMTTGGQEIIDLIYELMSFQNYALKFNSYGLYGNEVPVVGRSRHSLVQARYLANSFQNMSVGGQNFRINNLQRPRTVVINSETNLPNLSVAAVLPNNLQDNSKFILSQIGDAWVSSNFTAPISSRIAAHYVGLKVDNPNQYGKLDGIRQVPSGRPFILKKTDEALTDDVAEKIYETGKIKKDDTTEVIFGGDSYIARYSEKVIMPFFWDFLMGQPDGYNFNYFYHQNVPYVRFWYNSDRYNLSGIVQPITSLSFTWANDPSNAGVPSALHNLDRNQLTDLSEDNTATEDDPFGGAPAFGGGTTYDGPPAGDGLFTIKHRYMYTHCNGANDFFVETKINVGYRDWRDELGKRHYDTDEFADLTELFHAKIIKNGNFFRYDNSLQKDQMFTQNISYGFIQDPTYDPFIAEECWVHYPKRLIYSRQAMLDATQDMWRIFLPQDYVDFKNSINTIKPINKTGAMILFPHLAPVMWSGINTLQAGQRDIILGDGGLFNQRPQNVVNADLPHEYGSCESSRSAINTPSGLYFISQQQGKIFQYTKGLVNIAEQGMKQWFNKYLPSRLLAAFPDMENHVDVDNPIAGVGCQSVYDPNYDLVYFCKKDYEVINDECLEYDPDTGVVVNETECYDVEPILSCPPDYELIDGECCIDIVRDPIWTCTTVNSTQEDLTVINPNFEIDEQPPGQIGTLSVASGLTPGPWVQCKRGPGVGNYNPSGLGTGNSVIDAPPCFPTATPTNQQTPDTLPFEDCSIGFPLPGDSGWLPAYQGKTYIGMTIQTNGIGQVTTWGPNYNTWQEGVSQELSSPMTVGTTYQMTLALTQGWEDQTPDIVVSIWGGSDQCPCEDNGPMSSTYLGYDNNTHNSEILWTSPALTQSPPQWTLYTATFTPTSPHSHIHFRVGRLSGGLHMTLPSTTTNGYVYMDGISTIQSTTEVRKTCECPEGTDMYWTGTDTPATEEDCINCISGGYNVDEPCVFAGCVECRFAECIPPDEEDVVTPIDLDNEEFFKDISWTVSYDPKIKAWVSFHDWHPELTFPSLNHFLTTKTKQLEVPYCPPPYIYNPETGMCENYECPEGSVYQDGQCCTEDRQDVDTIRCDEHDNDWPVDPSEAITSLESVRTRLINNQKLDLLTRSDNSKLTKAINITRDENDMVYIKMDQSLYSNIKDLRPIKFNIDLPFLDNKTLSLSYEYANNKKRGLKLLRNTEDGIIEEKYVPKVRTYKLVDKEYSGFLMFLESKDILYGILKKDDKVYEFIHLEGDTYGIYDTQKSIHDMPSFECANDKDAVNGVMAAVKSQRSGNLRMNDEFCINLGVDVDYFTYLDFDQNTFAVADWIQTIIDYTNDVYSNDLNCTVEVTVLHIWEQTIYDVAGSTTAGGVITDYGDFAEYNFIAEGFYAGPPHCADYNVQCLINWNGIPELAAELVPGLNSVDMLHMITRKQIGGGIAHGIGGYCELENNMVDNEFMSGGAKSVAVSGSLIPQFPSFEYGQEITGDNMGGWIYQAVIVPHEMGHVVGAYHSHNCFAYNADPTYNYAGGALDNCVITGESGPCNAGNGVCPPDNNTTFYNTNLGFGTLMSYCHVGNGCNGDVAVQLQFHPVVKEQRIIPLLEDHATPECSACVPPLGGCTDPLAENYNPNATFDDGSCTYREICGCKCDTGYTMVYAGTTNPIPEAICIQYGGTNTECILVDCEESPYEPFPPSYELGGIWRHNDRCDLYTNYYNEQYGWEIEFVESQGQVVNTLRNVEYEMEAWLYKTPEDTNGNPLEGYSSCENKYHELDFNFNKAIIYNTEQVSGLLNLVLAQKNNAWFNNQFPNTNGAVYNILYKKEEQKFRFNQFWDTTRNRGEIVFPNGDFDSNIFTVKEPIWHTELDGYTRQLNPQNLNYFKDPLERKKFRHYWNKILLRREPLSMIGPAGPMLEPETRNMIFKVENSNINLSFR